MKTFIKDMRDLFKFILEHRRACAAIVIGSFFFWELGIYTVMTSQCDEAFQDARVVARPDGIHFDGTITQQSVNALVDRIDASKDATPTVWLESGGGDVDAALDFALMVARRPLRMSVGQNALCASSCVILYLAGSERYADSTAGFGLHAPYCNGVPADLECLVEKNYQIGDDRYRRFMQLRAPDWYKMVNAVQGMDYPPERPLCYTFPNGADKAPENQNTSDKTRAACALDAQLLNDVYMKPEYRLHAACPVTVFSRLKMIALWDLFIAGSTARHQYPS